LENTLKSIEKSKYKKSIEVVIVDDASEEDQRLEDLDFDLNIKLIRIEKKDKTWVNPSIPYNIGFKNATGNKIIIQNPECFHVGDIIESVMTNLKNGDYLSFGCYSINQNTLNNLNKVTLDDKWVTNVNNVIQPKNVAVKFDGDDGWYNHITYKPTFLHFCSAITKSDLDKVGGFDERFANGIAYEDNEFLFRIRKKMGVKFIHGPYVIHQFHGATSYKNDELVMRNYHLCKKLMK